LEPFLRDESYPLADVAGLFEIGIGELRAYKNRLGILRRRGRKQICSPTTEEFLRQATGMEIQQ
jgi:hypothetical protein